MKLGLPSMWTPPIPPFVLRTQLNVLCLGTTKQASDFIAGLLPSLAEPIVLFDAADSLQLREPIGTLILANATEMSMAQQVDLLARLEDSLQRTRLITTVGRPLFPEVEAGRFLDALYYRLNTILLDFREPSVQHSERPGQPRSEPFPDASRYPHGQSA
jgi:hypothetical protein